MIPAEARAITERHQTSPPIDVLAVAKEFGVFVYSARLAEDVSGALVRDPSYGSPSGFVILVDRNEPSVRQRFTAAHELGHYVLHRALVGDRLEDNYLLRSNGLSNRQEREANKFAAELLMPAKLISKALEDGYRTPQSLAKLFHVSELAMSIQLGLVT